MSQQPGQSAQGAPRRKSNRGRRIRQVFRGFGLLCLTAVLLGLAVWFFLHQVGVPQFVTERALAEVRAQGWQVQFQQLRWQWNGELVADKLVVQRTNAWQGPKLFFQQARLRFHPPDLRRFSVKPSSLTLHDGRLAWIFGPSDQAQSAKAGTTNEARAGELDELQGKVHFDLDGTWVFESLQARALGLRLSARGSLTNALQVRDWRVGERPRPALGLEDRLGPWLDEARTWRFAGQPALSLHFSADGRDWKTLRASLHGSIEAVAGRGSAGTARPTIGWAVTNLDFRLDASAVAPPPLPVRQAGSLSYGELGRARWQFHLTATNAQVGELRAASVGVSGDYQTELAGDALPLGKLTLRLQGLKAPWAATPHLQAVLETAEIPHSQDTGTGGTSPRPVQTTFHIQSQEIVSDVGTNAVVELRGTLRHALDAWLPATLSSDLRLERNRTRWGNLSQAEVHFTAALPAWKEWQLLQAWPSRDASPYQVWAERLRNFGLDGRLVATRFSSSKLHLETLNIQAGWQYPWLSAKVSCPDYDGELTASAKLQALTREVFFDTTSSLDAHRVAPVLEADAQRWLSRFSWKSPPKVRASGRLVLPAWSEGADGAGGAMGTSRPTSPGPGGRAGDSPPPIDWSRDLLPSLSLAGEFSVAEGAYQGIPFLAAQSPFWVSNAVFRVPLLRVHRPEGVLEGDYSSYPATKSFQWRIKSGFDPRVVKPMFQHPDAQRGFDFLEFSTPPVIEAEVWGRWHDPDQIGVQAYLQATNFVLRGEPVQFCRTRVEYTNKLLRCIGPEVVRPGERGVASMIVIDIGAQKLYLTNAAGNLDAHAVTRVIGPKPSAALKPYKFATPPEVTVNGTVDLKKKRYEENLHFHVAGRAFRWEKFNLERLEGDVFWIGKLLMLSNVTGRLHGGEVLGGARFDFWQSDEPQFAFKVQAEDVDFRAFVRDLDPKTNRLEGKLSGTLEITDANAGLPKSWQGFGEVRLRDGLIWDIPVFGVFSPILNTLVPGLGNSRAKHASASYIITNSVIYSDDLDIHATAMRMNYSGTVDFEKRVDGRMEAELMRDIPGFGVLISKLFWPVTKLFEYKVSGTVTEPTTEPLYILPKIVLLPFLPLKALGDLFREGATAPESPEK